MLAFSAATRAIRFMSRSLNFRASRSSSTKSFCLNKYIAKAICSVLSSTTQLLIDMGRITRVRFHPRKTDWISSSKKSERRDLDQQVQLFQPRHNQIYLDVSLGYQELESDLLEPCNRYIHWTFQRFLRPHWLPMLGRTTSPYSFSMTNPFSMFFLVCSIRLFSEPRNLWEWLRGLFSWTLDTLLKYWFIKICSVRVCWLF